MAERELTAGILTAIAAGTIRPVFLFEAEYDNSGTPAYLRLWTGYGTLSWGGYSWTGGGNLLTISPIREATSLEAIGFTVTLSGLPAASLSLFLQSMRKNKPGKLWLGFLDANNAIIADPYQVRRGRFDVAPIRRTGETVTIEASYEGPLARLLVPNGRRYTHEDQQLRLAGDKGFDQVPELQDSVDQWGDAVQSPPAVVAPPSAPSSAAPAWPNVESAI